MIESEKLSNEKLREIIQYNLNLNSIQLEILNEYIRRIVTDVK